MVGGTGSWIGVPELGLQQLATGSIEAAGIGHNGSIGAAQGKVEAEVGMAGQSELKAAQGEHGDGRECRMHGGLLETTLGFVVEGILAIQPVRGILYIGD